MSLTRSLNLPTDLSIDSSLGTYYYCYEYSLLCYYFSCYMVAMLLLQRLHSYRDMTVAKDIITLCSCFCCMDIVLFYCCNIAFVLQEFLLLLVALRPKVYAFLINWPKNVSSSSILGMAKIYKYHSGGKLCVFCGLLPCKVSYHTLDILLCCTERSCICMAAI